MSAVLTPVYHWTCGNLTGPISKAKVIRNWARIRMAAITRNKVRKQSYHKAWASKPDLTDVKLGLPKYRRKSRAQNNVTFIYMSPRYQSKSLMLIFGLIYANILAGCTIEMPR